jgi:hypothetical protein
MLIEHVPGESTGPIVEPVVFAYTLLFAKRQNVGRLREVVRCV